MPVIHYNSNFHFQKDEINEVAGKLTKLASEVLEKPLPAVMFMHSEMEMFKAGNDDICGYVEFKYVGSASLEQKTKLCDGALEILREYTKVDPHRVYINIIENARENAWKYTEK